MIILVGLVATACGGATREKPADVALYPVEVEGRWGYIDRSGKLAVKPQFDEADTFADGLARVRVWEQWGYIDPTGAFVIEPRFEYAEGFRGGLAYARQGTRQGYIDRTGTFVWHKETEPALRIRGIEPKEGPAAGGQSVTISGVGFEKAGSESLEVYVGKQRARALEHEDQRIVIETPPGEPGQTVSISVVFNGERKLEVEGAYRYADADPGEEVALSPRWEELMRFTEEMASIIEANKDDCTKMGEALAAFLDANQEVIEWGKEMQGNYEQAKAFMERYKDRMTAATTKMAAMGKCAADPAVAKALQKL